MGLEKGAGGDCVGGAFSAYLKIEARNELGLDWTDYGLLNIMVCFVFSLF